MDQLRLNFKLNFFFLKNKHYTNNLYFYTYFMNPILYIDYLDLELECFKSNWFNKNNFRKLIEIDNNFFKPKNFIKFKKMKCKKILFKKRHFINLLYF